MSAKVVRLSVRCNQCNELANTFYQMYRVVPGQNLLIPIPICSPKCMKARVEDIRSEMRQLDQLIAGA